MGFPSLSEVAGKLYELSWDRTLWDADQVDFMVELQVMEDNEWHLWWGHDPTRDCSGWWGCASIQICAGVTECTSVALDLLIQVQENLEAYEAHRQES